jgi:hypothetical protein
MNAAAAEVPLKPQPQTKPQCAAVKPASPVVPIKVGFFGGQGAGKTTSAAMLALALSKELHKGAPVWVTDTEPGWQFLRPMFAAEGVQLEQRTVPTFKAMLADIREAERAGACVYAVDSLTPSEFCDRSGFHLLFHRPERANARRFCGRKWSLCEARGRLIGFVRDCLPSGHSQRPKISLAKGTI